MFGSLFGTPKKRAIVIRPDVNGKPKMVGRIKEHYLKDMLFEGYIKRTTLKVDGGNTSIDGFECIRNCEFGRPDDAEISLVVYKGDYILRHEDAVEN